MKMGGQVRVQFVEMQTDGQMAAWRAALATLANVIERYQKDCEREGAVDEAAPSTLTTNGFELDNHRIQQFEQSVCF